MFLLNNRSLTIHTDPAANPCFCNFLKKLRNMHVGAGTYKQTATSINESAWNHMQRVTLAFKPNRVSSINRTCPDTNIQPVLQGKIRNNLTLTLIPPKTPSHNRTRHFYSPAQTNQQELFKTVRRLNVNK